MILLLCVESYIIFRIVNIVLYVHDNMKVIVHFLLVFDIKNNLGMF